MMLGLLAFVIACILVGLFWRQFLSVAFVLGVLIAGFVLWMMSLDG